MRLFIRLPAAALALGLSISVARAGEKDTPPPPPPVTTAAEAGATTPDAPATPGGQQVATAGQQPGAPQFAGRRGPQLQADGQEQPPQPPAPGEGPQGPGVQGPGPQGGRGIGGGFRAGFGSGPACNPCHPEPRFVEKCITRFRTEWREREVPVTIFRDVCKTVTVPETYTVMVPGFREEKRCETTFVCKPKKVERDVTFTKQVQITVTDPCTGCKHFECKPEVCTRHECATIVEKVPVTREFVVKVPFCHPEVRTREKCVTVHERVPETIDKHERYCVQVPYQVTIKVPVCQPVAVACCTTVCKPFCQPSCYRSAYHPCH